MTSPDYSEGVPRGVVNERLGALGHGPLERGHDGTFFAEGRYMFTHTCTDCPQVTREPNAGERCPGIKPALSCPGVLVPILDDPEPEEDVEALKRIACAMAEDAKADTKAGRGGGFRIPDSMLVEPAPAPVEGAVERVSLFLDEWGAESVQPINATPSLDLMPADLRAVLDELERVEAQRVEARKHLIHALLGLPVPEGLVAESIQTEPSDTHWLSPKGGEPATGGES